MNLNNYKVRSVRRVYLDLVVGACLQLVSGVHRANTVRCANVEG